MIKNKIKLKKIKLVEVNISENIDYLKKYKKNLLKIFACRTSSHIFDLMYYLFVILKSKNVSWNIQKFSISLVLITNKIFNLCKD